jgi:hypothetical protein
MGSCRKSKLFNHIHARQVVAAPAINNNANTAIFNHVLGMEQIMALVGLGLGNLRTQDSLCN